MPYANNNGVKIYYEVEGQGPPLVLAHGATGTLEVWRSFGFAGGLKRDYTLVLFDARGHGRSDKPHEASAYAFANMVGDVLAVLDSLGITKAHYYGYSMGAAIGFRVAKACPSRFLSFILGGSAPYRNEGRSLQDALVPYKTLLSDPNAFLLLREKDIGRPLTNEERTMYLSNDAEALISLATARVTGQFDGPYITNDDLSSIAAPCLLYCGDVDPFHAKVKESADHIPGAIFISLPGLNHLQVSRSSDLVLPYVKEFLTGVSKT